MAHADFVHLRTHTAYSLLEGALKIGKLAELCRKYAMPACAMTDSRNLFGAYEFSLTLAEAGVQPIIGCELAVRREEGANMQAGFGANVRAASPDKLVVLVQSEVGYGNLARLLSRAYLDGVPGEAAQVSFADLTAHGTGLIALTGGTDGPIGRLLLGGQEDAALARLLALKDAFAGRLYVELQRHGLD